MKDKKTYNTVPTLTYIFHTQFYSKYTPKFTNKSRKLPTNPFPI